MPASFAVIDHRGTTATVAGARLAIEVARHDPRRAVLRVGPPDYVLPWVLIVGGLVPMVICGWNAWSLRRRQPQQPHQRRRQPQRPRLQRQFGQRFAQHRATQARLWLCGCIVAPHGPA